MKKIIYGLSILVLTMISSSVYASDFSPLTMSGNIYVTSGYVGDTIGTSVTSVISTLKTNDTTNESPWSIQENSGNNGFVYFEYISDGAIGGSIPTGLSFDTGMGLLSGSATNNGIWYFSITDTNGFGTHIIQITVLANEVVQETGFITTERLDNVDTSVNNLLTTVFEVLKLLPYLALIIGGFYLLDRLFGILPRPGSGK